MLPDESHFESKSLLMVLLSVSSACFSSVLLLIKEFISIIDCIVNIDLTGASELIDTAAHVDRIRFIGLLVVAFDNTLYPLLHGNRITVGSRNGKSNEFIAADTSDDICISEGFLKDLSDSPERKVTIIMAKLIVDHLEVIHIRIADNSNLIVIDGICEHLLSVGDESSSVIKACEFVFLSNLF